MHFTLYCKGYRITRDYLVGYPVRAIRQRFIYEYIEVYHGIQKQRGKSAQEGAGTSPRPLPELLHFSSLLLSVHLHSSYCGLAFV